MFINSGVRTDRPTPAICATCKKQTECLYILYKKMFWCILDLDLLKTNEKLIFLALQTLSIMCVPMTMIFLRRNQTKHLLDW